MTRAVIVHLNVDDGFVDPQAIADDVAEACEKAGLDVVSAAMWTAPTLAAPPTQTMFPTQPLPPAV